MSPLPQILLSGLLLAGVLAVAERTDLDLAVQDRLYDFQARRWLVDRKKPLPRAVLYTGVKGLVIGVGVASVVGLLASWRSPRLRPARLALLRTALAIILVPAVIAAVKNLSNVYTPAQIHRYGGSKPRVKPFQPPPAGVKPGRPGKGFPAAHASAGFSLMILYYVLPTRRWRRIGLAAGIVLGWTTGLSQTATGQHFLSHTVVTWIVAWMLIQVIVLLTARGAARAADPPATA
jgi:membrane-associated PAP2 superfamily phosphatase